MAVLNISLNDALLNATTKNIKNASKALDTSTSKMPEVKTCAGIKVSEYEEKCRKISSLLEQYKKLLDKDIKDLDLLRDNLTQADIQSKEIFSKVLY